MVVRYYCVECSRNTTIAEQADKHELENEGHFMKPEVE